MENNKATRGKKQKRNFVMVDNYMIESNVMTDNEFKLYLVLLKYADSDNQCFPSLKTLGDKMGKSKRQIQNLVKSLEDKGFLTVENRKTENGDYTSNLYTIWTDKELFIPEMKKELVSDTDQSTDTNPQQFLNIINTNNTLLGTNSQDDNVFSRQMINEIYDFNILIENNQGNKSLLDAIMELLLEVLNSSSQTIRVNQEEKQAAIVKSRFLKLNYMHIQYVINSVTQQSNVKAIRSYLITSLYNSYTTIDVHYSTMINKDK